MDWLWLRRILFLSGLLLNVALGPGLLMGCGGGGGGGDNPEAPMTTTTITTTTTTTTTIPSFGSGSHWDEMIWDQNPWG